VYLRLDRVRRPLFLALVLVSLAMLAVMYLVQGPGWDLIAHYENGRGLLNPALYSCLSSPPCGLDGGQLTFWYGTYFEPYRAPLEGALFALLYLPFGSSSIIAYVILLFLLYLAAIRFLGKRMGMDRLLLYSLMLSPAVLTTSIIIGGEEIISLVLLSVGLAFLARRSPWSGFFFGLAALGKYPTLILAPMLLLLIEPRKVLYSAAMFLAASAPWLLFSWIYFHSAFASYAMSSAIAGDNMQSFQISGYAVLSVFAYSLIFLTLALFAVRRKLGAISKAIRNAAGKGFFGRIRKGDRLYLYCMLLALFALSVVGTLYFAPYYDTSTEIRYGYLLSFSSALIAAMVLNDARKYTKANLPVISAMLSVALLSLFLVQYYATNAGAPQLNANSAAFGNADAVVHGLGYGNCRMISNDWVYMLYHNVTAFPQFYHNQSVMKYPALVFHNGSSATNISFAHWLANATPVYSSGNFSVLLPGNHECIPG
jgi:hypothetical protein